MSESATIEVLTNKGYLSRVDRVRVEPEWQGTDGIWALASIYLITETVVSVGCCAGLDGISSDGTLSAACFPSHVSVVASIFEGSQLHTNFGYTDSNTGAFVPFQDGDLVAVYEDIFTIKIKQYSASTYTDQTVSLGSVYADENILADDNSQDYPYYYGINSGAVVRRIPKIVTNAENPDGSFTVTGETYANCVIDVINETPDGDVTVLSGADSNTFLSSGLTYDRAAGATKVKIKCYSDGGCDLRTSNKLTYVDSPQTGIGHMIIDQTFVVTETDPE